MTAKLEVLKPRNTDPDPDFADVVKRLQLSREVTHNIRHGGKVRELPSTAIVMDVVDGVVATLFPTHLGPIGLKSDDIDSFVSNTLHMAATRLRDQICRGLQFNTDALSPVDARRKAHSIVRDFMKQLPDIRALLVSDLRAALRHDPSAESIAEVLLCYRSSTAIIYHRLAHTLHSLGARLVARVIADLAHATTGIDIHPGAKIGSGFFIDRGTGVVIGETAVIGENVCLHQGVTLGAAQVMTSTSDAPPKRIASHPIIEDNVVIHSGASVLGRITIGAGSLIGGNVWLTRSIPAGSIVTQAATNRSELQVPN